MVTNRTAAKAAFVVMAILILFSSYPAHGWQLGIVSDSSVGYQGVRASQETNGAVPGVLFFAAVSAFTDTDNVWHAIAMVQAGTNNPYVEAEYKLPGQNYVDVKLCTVSKGTYNDDYVYYSSPAFTYKSSTAGCSSYTSPSETGIPTINSGGSIDMMESNDNNANDFKNLAANTNFQPTLEYYNGGWQTTSYAITYANAPVNTIGGSVACSGHTPTSVTFSSIYAPPWVGGLRVCP